MSEFTKGPWRVGEFGDVFTDNEDTILASIIHDTEDLYNAHLIAAAPELYEALEGMLKYIPDGIVECRGDKCREPWCASCCGFEAAEFALDQIRFDYQRSKVALAKARGETE